MNVATCGPVAVGSTGVQDAAAEVLGDVVNVLADDEAPAMAQYMLLETGS